MINILYNDLKTLISSSGLIIEEQYRITDYVTTVSKANYTSAGYKFDIVVTALTTNTLYEYATLLANSTETYFDANALLLYNIKYNVNNQIPGYYNDWVDVNGKGCIYYMVDDKGNEAPFDFKNIKYYGRFLFNSSIDGSDTSQTISTYNSIKEVIDDDTFNIPQVSFIDECHNVSIDINATQVSISECNNLQIGKSCQDCEYSEVSNVVVGNDFIHSELTFINGGEIGNNNNGIIATNQNNLIIKNNNTSITLGGGSNGIIIDSNNTVVTIGNYAKDVYINASKTINLGNNIEQFNISSSYDVVVADDCKLFTLNKTNHLTSTTGCQSINAISNDYITLTEAVTNITISEGLTNLILDGTKLVGTDAKNIIQEDEKVVVINEQTNSEVVLTEDGTTTSNPNSYITDSPADNKIYGRKDGNWEEIDTSGGGGSISLTWSALKTLRDAGTLVPGQKYRITDYSTIILVANYGSAAHQFDIIVTALSTNKLSENAKVCKSDNIVNEIERNYFNSSKLEAWEIKYCLDNDTNRFDWATSIGKGVIYYMKDEWGNECPYDFKNIRFLNQDDDFIFTFGGVTDDSLTGGCNGNIIKWKKIAQKLYLNFNAFGINCVGNYLDYNCSSNNFGDSCQYNTFGNGCNDNTFSDDCNSNTFCDSCYSNTFGEWCTSNTFGDYCQSNNFGNDYNDNTFGNWCYSNTFGDDCESNNFGDYCRLNNFYDGVSGTNKKNYIRYIVLEDGVQNNNFYSNVPTNSSSYLQRIRIKGLENATTTDTTITLTTANTKYEWVVAKDSSGVIQQYCPENLTVDTGITDAPIDGTPYSRQDGGWVVAETGIEEALSDGKTYGRKNGAWSEIVTSGGGGTSTVSITWSSLKALRDSGTLVPGQSYRITDYVCTTVTTNTRSANKQFDIIVTALSTNKLSENASAMYHEGDTYFSSNNANLESWELKYCIDNDTNRFAWADNNNGKGVIYYMKDNYNNELPYDFKNIQYFKNSAWKYTFGGATDNSLVAACYNNIIKEYILDNKQTLNNITFGHTCYSNTFGTGCYENKFGDYCYSNTFGYGCYTNTFGGSFQSNTFGVECKYNTFGNNCIQNAFGNSCTENTIGTDCYFNTFGNSCQFNTFGNNCDYNTFGNDCRVNNFYDGLNGVTKKNYIQYIVLEDGVKYNNFYSDVPTGYSAILQRIRIKGLFNTTATNTTITLSATNTNYEWVVAKNSSGTIKQYCPENLVP